MQASFLQRSGLLPFAPRLPTSRRQSIWNNKEQALHCDSWLFNRSFGLNARQLPLARGKSIFKEVNRSLLPGNVPNTAWRRLLLDIKEALSLTDLLRIHAISSKNTRVWQARHEAAMLAKAAALTYYKALAAAAGQPSKLRPVLGLNSSGRNEDPGGYTAKSSIRGYNKDGTSNNDRDTSTNRSRLAVCQPLGTQLQQLLSLLHSGKTFGQAVRMVAGYRLAQLLVSCTNLDARMSPGLQATLICELLRDNSKKLRGCGVQLFAELVASLSQTRPFIVTPFPALPGTNISRLLTSDSALTPSTPIASSSQASPSSSGASSAPQLSLHTFNTTSLPSTLPRAKSSSSPPVPNWPMIGLPGSPFLPSPSSLGTANPLEQQAPPPPSIQQLAVRKHARTRPSLQRLRPENQLPQQEYLDVSKPSIQSSEMDTMRMWNELHRAAHTRLQSRAATPVDIARMAWGFSEAGYHDVQLFAAFESSLLPEDASQAAGDVQGSYGKAANLTEGGLMGDFHLDQLLSSATSSKASNSSDGYVSTQQLTGGGHNMDDTSYLAVSDPLRLMRTSDLPPSPSSTTLPYTPQALADLACAFAQAGYFSPRLMSAINKQFLKVAADAHPLHVAMLCWACTMSKFEDNDMQGRLASHILQARCRLTVQEICIIASAFSQWDPKHHQPLLQHLARQLLRGNAYQPSPLTLANASELAILTHCFNALCPPLKHTVREALEARMALLTH